MKTITAFVLCALALVPSASAHGFLSNIVIDGKSNKGNAPGDTPSPSIIRQITAIDPVKGAMNPDMNCGIGAMPAALVADAQPGSSLQFFWSGGEGQAWFHVVGPVMTYLGSCGDASADKCDSSKVKWFKVDQAGKDSKDVWAQANFASRQPVGFTLPKNLAAGNYLIRHEIVALHLGSEPGGAEFYPSCSQIRVGGNQSGVPTSSELVSFPGGYTDTEPGILDKAIYDPGSPYTFPGPQLATLAAGSGSSSGSQPPALASNSTDAVASPAASPSPATQAIGAVSTKTCQPGQKRMVKRHTFPWSH